MSKVEFVSIEKSFGKAKILTGINLTIESGEFLVLVGPSGCGKSTLLRLLAGLESPTCGDIRVDGKSVVTLPPRQRALSMVFQSYALYPHLTVYENLGFGLRLSGVSENESRERIREVSEILQITGLLDRKPAFLSGGQRQRVALGRALVRKTKLILFDEPLSNLDATLRAQMRYEIKKIHHLTKSTMVYVTHDQIEATTLGDRIAVLNQGKIEQIASATDIFSTPANHFVAGFIGSPEMNFLPGRVLNRPDADFGIRPEDIQIGSGSYSGTFEVEEYLGSHYLIHVQIGGKNIRVISPYSLGKNTGDAIHIDFNMTKAHFFDKVTGLRVN